MRALIHVSDEVRAALEEERAVVALETTLVAHGFPAPDGVATGVASEAAVRAAGAVPATVGVLDGQIRIGLTPSELERFTPDARKLGPRDLAVCAVQGAVAKGHLDPERVARWRILQAENRGNTVVPTGPRGNKRR